VNNDAPVPAATERNWRRFNIVASSTCLAEQMSGTSNLSVNK